MASTGQLWFGADGETSGTSDGSSDFQIGYVGSDGTGATVVYAQNVEGGFSDPAVDPVDGLWFWLQLTQVGSANQSYVIGSGHIGSGAESYTSTPLGPQSSTSLSGVVADPVNHLLYASVPGPDDASSGIYKMSYNATTGAMTNVGFIVNDSSSAGGLQNPGAEYLDVGSGPVASQTLYVVDSIRPADVSEFDYATNGIYKITNLGSTPTVAKLTSDSALINSGNYPDGIINAVTINKAQGLVYFATETTAAANNDDVPTGNCDEGQAQDTIWYISVGSTNQTPVRLANLPTGTIQSPADDGLTYDPVENALYVSDA